MVLLGIMEYWPLPTTGFQNKHHETNSSIPWNTVNMLDVLCLSPITYTRSPPITCYKQSDCRCEDAQETWDSSAEGLRSGNEESTCSNATCIFQVTVLQKRICSRFHQPFLMKSWIHRITLLTRSTRPLCSGIRHWNKHRCADLTGHQKHKTAKTREPFPTFKGRHCNQTSSAGLQEKAAGEGGGGNSSLPQPWLHYSLQTTKEGNTRTQPAVTVSSSTDGNECIPRFGRNPSPY